MYPRPTNGGMRNGVQPMMYFGRLKRTVVFGICLLGVLLCLPNLMPAPASWLPWRAVSLGLDLRGGSYLLMEVDMGTVLRERLQSLTDAVRQVLLKANIGYQNLAAQPAQNRVSVRIREPGQRDAALAAVRALGQGGGIAPDYDIAQANDGTLTLTLSEVALRARAEAAVTQSIEIVRRRIDQTGVVEPQIARQGDDRIVIELPGVDDPKRIEDLIGKTAHMTFQLVDENANMLAAPPPGVEYLPMQDNPNQQVAVYREIAVDGGNLTDAQAGENPQTGQWVVNFTFDSIGSRRFADVTRGNVGHPFAIVLDGKVISAPVIREAITGGRGEISGNFTAQSASDLAVLLRAGALPAPLTVVEERTVGPELGADSIRAGIISLAAGFVLVCAFMGVFYGLFGWYANLALVFNLALMLAILSLFRATLTLPGMAGILLTLGMAVDANILINERIREEVRNGRTPLNAMETGFRRAYSTIIDSNVTALLAHVMLFVFGSGPVRGFALTITVGIVTTLFTATLFARMLMVRWYITRRPAALPV
jgi:preprotein translocase subunit SecD